MQKSLDNGLQSTSQAVCQFLNGFFLKRAWLRDFTGVLILRVLFHTSLQQLLNVKQQLTTAYWHSSWLVKQSTMSGITGLLECVLILFLRSMVTANKARVGGDGGEVPAGIRKGIQDCKA